MRIHFAERLDEIRNEVIRMGAEAGDMVRRSVEATLNGDTDLAAEIVLRDDAVDLLERSALNKTVVAVMAESPVARDLRFLVSTVGVVGEIEKVGDDAVKLARRATKLSGRFPVEMKVALLELGEQSRRLFASSLRLYADYSPELAKEIIDGDQEIDRAYRVARNRVFELIQANPADTEDLVRIIECFHAVEHVADHAVAVAARMRMLHES